MKNRSSIRHRDGSIRVINGCLYARVQYIDESTGKRKEKLRKADSRTHAKELIKSMRAELETSGQSALESDQITVAQLADRYKEIRLIPAIYQNGIKVAGKRSIGPTLSALKSLVNAIGHKRVRKIRPSDIEHYKLQRLNTPVEIPTNVLVYDPNVKKNVKKKKVVTRPRKIASVNRELELLRAMLNFAKSEGAIMVSPFETGTKLISTAAEVERDRVLSIDEERRLLDASVGRRAHIRPLIILAVDTAMRRGELFKLRWEDVDLPLRQITIKAENAKTERTRLVGLTERAVKELENLWDRSPKDVRGLVFGITSTVKNAWKSLRQECGLSDLRFHDLRHTATTRLIRAGVPASEVMKITGHTQLKTFLRYLNLTNESVTASAVALDGYLAEQKIGESGVIEVPDRFAQ